MLDTKEKPKSLRELRDERETLLVERKELKRKFDNQLDEAKAVFHLIFHERFKKGGEWLDRTKRVGRKHAMVVNLLGGVRHLYGYLHPEKSVVSMMDRRGPNASIQGPASNIGFIGGYMTRKLIWEFFESRGVMLGYYPCNSVHDCVVGGTLVPTTSGLRRIDEMDYRKYQVGSRFKQEAVGAWISKGKRPTINTVTDLGITLGSTKNHKLLTLKNGQCDWTKAGKMQVGDYLCMNLNPVVRDHMYPVAALLSDYKTPEWIPNKCTTPRPRSAAWIASCQKPVTKPSHMTKELAFILGLVVSEGSIRSRAIQIPNTDTNLLDKFDECVRNTFGLTPKRRIARKASGYGTGNKTQYTSEIYSSEIVLWMKELGLYVDGYKNGKSPSYHKAVPFSILHADSTSQLAFLAAYLEGDGHVSAKGEIIFNSYSEHITVQIQSMLISHGYPAYRGNRNVRIGGAFAAKLFTSLLPHMVSKITMHVDATRQYGYGVPSKYWVDLIKSRRISNTNQYVNDEGKHVSVSWTSKHGTIHRNWRRDKFFDYRAYENGRLDEFLIILKKISVHAYDQLIKLLKLKYYYTSIKSIDDGGMQNVYDLSIKNGEPAYIANGLIVHNSTESECSIVNIPLVDYLCTHAYSTLIHRWMRDVMDFESSISFEMDSKIGPALSEMKDALRWDDQVAVIEKSLIWGNENLRWNLAVGDIMPIVEANAKIIFKIRRKEIDEQLRRDERVSYSMFMNRDNCMDLGLVFDMPPERSKKSKGWTRELE